MDLLYRCVEKLVIRKLNDTVKTLRQDTHKIGVYSKLQIPFYTNVS